MRISLQPLLAVLVLSGTAPAFASEIPEGAPSAEEHARRAAERQPVTRGAVATPGEGMIAAGRFEFPPLFLPAYGVESIGGGFVATRTARDRLVVLDARSGSIAGTLGFERYTTTLAVGQKGNRVLGIVGSYLGTWEPLPGHVVDLSDPFHPKEIAATDACGNGALVLPGGTTGLVYGSTCATLFDLETGSYRAGFGDEVRSAAAAVVDGSMLLVLAYYESSPRFPSRFAAWDVSNPASPIQRYAGETERYAEVLADRRGEIAIVAGYLAATILDAKTGMPLSTIPFPSGRRNVALADGGGIRMLAASRDEAVDLYDLADPANPVPAGTIPVRTIWAGYGQASPPLRPHPDRPWLAVAAVDPGGTVVVDLRDLSTLLSHRVEGTWPRAIAWTDLADGAPAIAFSAIWYAPNDPPRPEGGITFTETVAVSQAGTSPPAAGYFPVVPEDIAAAHPLAGRYVAVADANANAVVLVDTADWTVVQEMGFSRRLQSADGWLNAASNGTTFVVADQTEAEVFELRDDRLVRRLVVDNAEPWTLLGDVALTPDGTVLALWPDLGLLQLFRPDGEVREVAVRPGYSEIAVSPDGRRAVLSAGTVWVGVETPAAGVDLVSPRLLWDRAHGVAFADFVRGGSAIAATTVRGWGRYGPLLLDPETGEALGPPGDAAYAFFYFGPGQAFGEAEGQRIPYWHWTWSAWESSLFDISGDSARLVAISEEYDWDPIQLPRDDDRAGLEFRLEGTQLLSPDGEWVPFGPAPARETRRMRHGFYSGVEPFFYDDPQAVVVLRDPGVNRPPSADAGPDRVEECSSPSGTAAELDGSASGDPDSTPGTSDDVASFEWTLDGSPVGSEPRVEVSLTRGYHVASLEMRDVLEAVGSDQVVIGVWDTLPPVVRIALEPMIREGVWANEWSIDASAEDACEGALSPVVCLSLTEAVLAASVTWAPAAEDTIEVTSIGDGFRVRLIGPDRSRLEAIWNEALEASGLLPAEDAVRLAAWEHAPRGVSADLRAIYRLDAAGRVSSAEVYGPGSDVPVVASAADSGHRTGTAGTTLRGEIVRLCAELPANAACK